MVTSFSLGAIVWDIEIDNDRLDDAECYGLCKFTESKILLQDESLGAKRTESAIEQTLYHEVVHAILDTLGKRELSMDEEFVQSFSLLLHQFETSKK